MGEETVVVECRDCEFRESFTNLRRARVALDDHESTGHDVDWQIDRVAAGVERAGADAGICGMPDCENPDTPLLDRQPSDDES
ncbi:DUF7542 family protein [Halopiger aswanensis]|uniref:Uncharacterized protein n=1 Tax=Halopiger aswanensis TaxID=148449 RepID=A0A419W0X2_9EURY|nr:hypothetical protein [Halopiger aswanensis]RKD89064.1 hypothetical protein ATJ93_3886 [Halopiger aswanensis]